jgi:hypothetical protein
MDPILSKVKWNYLFYYPTANELESFSEAFDLHRVPDTIWFWSVMETSCSSFQQNRPSITHLCEMGLQKYHQILGIFRFKKQMKIEKSGIIFKWHTAAFLANVLTCTRVVIKFRLFLVCCLRQSKNTFGEL